MCPISTITVRHPHESVCKSIPIALWVSMERLFRSFFCVFIRKANQHKTREVGPPFSWVQGGEVVD